MATVTITATTPNPPLQVADGDVVTFRGWYTNSFVAADGVTPVEWGDGRQGFYYEYTCELNGSRNVVIPAITIQPTTGSNPTAGFLGALFVNGGFAQMVFGYPQATAGWQIPTSPTTTTFGALALYNAAVQLLYPPNTYPTFNQVVQLIEQLAGNQQYAAVGLAGITQLSVAPDVASEPKAWGVNDPLVVSYDNGDVSIPTIQTFQAGDFEVEQNASFISVNDSFTEDGGRTVFQAGGSEGAEYAGVIADCSTGIGEINIQSTGITNLFGANQVTSVGDGKREQNGTQLIVNDPTRMVVQSAVNQLPNDPSISAEQICFYLDESDGMLRARIRLSDGTYALWEGAYTPD